MELSNKSGAKCYVIPYNRRKWKRKNQNMQENKLCELSKKQTVQKSLSCYNDSIWKETEENKQT